MHTLRRQDRDRSMTAMVSFHRVPMPRGVAFAIQHIERHGARVDIFSGCRLDAVIREHNRQFGTHLSGQEELIERHEKDPAHNAAANPVTQTSHCLHADAYVADILSRYGTATHAGGPIPWWACGLDLADHGKSEDVSEFLHVAKKLNYSFVQPYAHANTEKHHVILAKNPIRVLEGWNVISEARTA